MRTKVHEQGLDWQIDSAGTGSWHVGNPPDPRSRSVAQQYGIDISGQRARQFKAGDLDEFDLVFAMDASNYQNILKHATDSRQEAKVHLIMNMADPGRNQGVPDPYWDDDGFEQVYQMLNRACESIIATYA